MKKIITIATILAIVSIIVIINYNDIHRLYKINQLAHGTINCINGKFSRIINDRTINDYKRLHTSNTELNHNNVTELINVYIDSVINGMKLYIKNNEEVVINKVWEHKEINSVDEVEKGKDIWMKYYVIDYGIGESFTNFDVKNYTDGTFKDALIEKLKNCLDYEEKDNKIEWYINSIEDKRIELPYNCYIDYKAYNFELNTNFKRAIDIDVSNYDFDIGSGIKKVTYETIDKKKETQEISIVRQKDGKYYISLSSILGEYGNVLAECTLSNHTVDRWMEEADIEFFEKYPIVN